MPKKLLILCLNYFSLSDNIFTSMNSCNSCLCNKSYKLLFQKSSFHSTKPLQLVFSDILGRPRLQSNVGFHYYVIFLDHFTRFSWIFPMKLKYDMVTIFPAFKNQIENLLREKIITLFLYRGGEYVGLAKILSQNGITHLTSQPHTPEHNGIS